MNHRDIERAELARDSLMEAYESLGGIKQASIDGAFRSIGASIAAVDEWLEQHKRKAYRVEVQAVVNVPVYVWAEDDAKACELARELVESKLSAQPLDIDDIDTDVYDSWEADDIDQDSCDIQQGDDQ